MNRFAPHFLILLIGFFSLEGLAQQNAKFSKPELNLEETNLLISFDILNSVPTDRFIVIIEVRGPDGRRIIPKAISGDIGEDVGGGSNKIIKWELESDNISMNSVLTLELVGKKIVKEEVVADSKQITRFGAMARSLSFPGWGLSVLNPGKPHWIRGLAGYGAIAGSLILNQTSYKNYEKYLDSSDETDRITFYNKSVNQEQWSVVLAYTAAGVWVADLVWTFIGARNPPKQYGAMQRKGISLGSAYEPLSDTPLLVIKYTF